MIIWLIEKQGVSKIRVCCGNICAGHAKKKGGGAIGALNYARALGFLRMLSMLGCLKTPTCLVIAY